MVIKLDNYKVSNLTTSLFECQPTYMDMKRKINRCLFIIEFIQFGEIQPNYENNSIQFNLIIWLETKLNLVGLNWVWFYSIEFQ